MQDSAPYRRLAARRRRRVLRVLTVAPSTLYFLILMLVFSTPQPVPTAAPTPSPMLTVLHLSGTGDLTSPTFTTGPDWTVSYTLDCPTGGTLRVVAIGGQLGGVTVADNAPSTTDIHNAPGTHQLRIESGCAWTLTVTNGDTLPRATRAGTA